MLQPHQKLSRKRRWVRDVLGNMGLLFTSYSEKGVVFGLWDFFLVTADLCSTTVVCSSPSSSNITSAVPDGSIVLQPQPQNPTLGCYRVRYVLRIVGTLLAFCSEKSVLGACGSSGGHVFISFPPSLNFIVPDQCTTEQPGGVKPSRSWFRGRLWSPVLTCHQPSERSAAAVLDESITEQP